MRNVFWSWLGVGANVVVGLVLSPYIIRHLGEERYGIWALVFALVDYLWFFDLGLNTAVATFCARFLARGETRKINEVINTALCYFSVLSVVIIGLSVGFSRVADHFFRISPAHRDEFSTLILLAGANWGLCIVLQTFMSALDGFQRFDLSSRVFGIMVISRSTLAAILIATGHGLVAMGLAFTGCQIAAYLVNFLNFRRIFPALRFSRDLVSFEMFHEVLAYGVRSFVANASGLALNQGGPILIGHYATPAYVGFYALPSRLLQYAVDAVTRIGMITRSSAAELKACGRSDDLVSLSVFTNRYSFALFLPLVLFLLVWGRELLLLWVGPQFAAHSAPLLPILLIGTAFVMAGQYNSSSVLFGLSKHGGYAQALVVEAVANVLLLIAVIPRYGIYGAACVSTALMVASRGIYTPWLVCRNLNYSFLRYMRLIYLRPMLAALPVLGWAVWSRNAWLPGVNWAELFVAGCCVAIPYGILVLFTCVESSHRQLLASRLAALVRSLRRPALALPRSA